MSIAPYGKDYADFLEHVRDVSPSLDDSIIASMYIDILEANVRTQRNRTQELRKNFAYFVSLGIAAVASVSAYAYASVLLFRNSSTAKQDLSIKGL